MPLPGRRVLHLRGLVARQVLFFLDTEHQDAVVAPCLDLGGGRQDAERAGSAGRLVPHRGLAEELRLHLRHHGCQVPLAAIELAERIAHVNGVDVVRVETARREGPIDGLAHHVGVVEPLTRPYAREISLVAADQMDRHRVSSLLSPQDSASVQ